MQIAFLEGSRIEQKAAIADVKTGHELMESSEHIGKIMLKVRGE